MSPVPRAGRPMPGPDSGLNTLRYRFRAAASEPEGALVLFHGRGADENDLFPLLDALDPDRRLVGVTPRGPLSAPAGGAHWYIVRQVGYPDPGTFDPTFERVDGWLRAFAQETGIPPERTILGGFSQGTVMSYALGLASNRPRPAAIIALSGFIPIVERFDIDLTRPLPPVAIGHGTHDPVISVEFGRRARGVLTEAGAEVLYHETPMGHTIAPGFVEQLVPWIERILLSEDPTA